MTPDSDAHMPHNAIDVYRPSRTEDDEDEERDMSAGHSDRIGKDIL